MPRPRTNFPHARVLLSDYRQTLRRQNLAPDTIAQRRQKVLRLADFLAPRHILTATTSDIEEWLDTTRITPETRITYISEVRSFYGWATAEGWLKVDPSRGLARPRVRKRLPRPIPDHELAEALSTAPARTLAILALMSYEGLRCVEVSRLEGQDVDRRTMVLRVERGKGDKTRLIPLHRDCLAALDAHGLPERGPVFPSLSSRHLGLPPHPISPGRVSEIISATLPGTYTAHQLRHWFGTMFYRTSKDLLLTAEVMGHSRTETTAGYAKADLSRAAEVVGKMVLPSLPEPGPADAEVIELPAAAWAPPSDDPPTARAL